MRIKYSEAGTEAWAVFDTSLAYTVINCPTCTDADSGTTISTTAVSGTLNNPDTTYSGFEGTTTICFLDEDNALDSNAPTTSNISSLPLPCIENANVHWITAGSTPSNYNDAIDASDSTQYYSAYIGLALG